MVIIRFLPNQGLNVNGLPATSIKIYYGAQQKIYTNQVVFSLNDIDTNSSGAYDPFSCTFVTVGNFVPLPIHGLVLTQQFYYGFSMINSNKEEGPIIADSVCGFTVTNNSDKVAAPKALRSSP
jgi:hypothetical protein